MPRPEAASRLLLAAALLASACGAPVTQTDAGPPRPAADATRASALRIQTLDGVTVRVPDAQGRPTVLYFMAAWCVSCIAGAVMLGELYRDYGPRGLRVVAIDVDPGESAQDLARFRELAGDPPYFWALDEGQRVTRAFGIRSLDATIIVDGAGEVVFRSETLPRPETLRRAVQLLLER